MIVSIKEASKPYSTKGLIGISRAPKNGGFGLPTIRLEFDDGRQRFVALKHPNKAKLFRIFIIDRKYDWKEIVFSHIVECLLSDDEIELNLTIKGIEKILEDFLENDEQRRELVLSSVRLC